MKLLESPITLARFDHLTGATVALSSLLKCITTALDQKVAVPREMAVIAKITGADYHNYNGRRSRNRPP